MTDDKDFKHLVREEARRTGRPYAEVRATMRPPTDPAQPPAALTPAEVAERVDAIVDSITSSVFGRDDAVRLVVLALLTPGNVLLSDVAGNGMMQLGKGVAETIGGRVVNVDGRTGLAPGETEAWGPNDVVVIAHFDGLAVADQVAVISAGRQPAIVLAKRNPIPGRMPHPPDDETRERFLFGPEFQPIDAETQLRIVSLMRDGDPAARSRQVVDIADLAAMRAATAKVAMADPVRRFAVDVAAGIVQDDAVMLGGSIIMTLALIGASAAAAIADGRGEVTIDDVRGLVVPVLAHRVVFRPDVEPDLPALIDRVTGSVLARR